MLISHEDVSCVRLKERSSDFEFAASQDIQSDHLFDTFDAKSHTGSVTVRTEYRINEDNTSWASTRWWLMNSIRNLPLQSSDSLEVVDHPTTPFLPTRLIHLQPSPAGALHAKLCDTADLDLSPRHTKYMTLSRHDPGRFSKCNATSTLKLQTVNLQEMKCSIGSFASQLSQTHLDVMAIAQSLGIGYVWIDTLCVIQDSPEDLAHEAILSRDVYGYSVCNIAVAKLDCRTKTDTNTSYVLVGGMHTGDDSSDTSNFDGENSRPIIMIRRTHASDGSRKDFEKPNGLGTQDWEVQHITLAPRVIWGYD